MYGNLLVELGPFKGWKLVSAAEYAAQTGGKVQLPDGAILLIIQTAKESFAVMMIRTGSGDYRATQIAR
jgi:hypothetical protein